MKTQLILVATTDLPFMLAQASFEGAVDNFYDFLKVILNLIATVMVLWSGYKFHDGQVREGTNALVGAFIVLLARIIVQRLAGAAS